MKIFCRIIIALGALLVTQTKANGNSLYEINQYNKMLGRTKVIANKNGIRVELKSQNTILVAAAPKWDVYLFSQKTKRYCMSSLALWRPYQARMSVFFGDELRKINWVPLKQKTSLDYGQKTFRNANMSKHLDFLETIPASTIGLNSSIIFSRYSGWSLGSPAVRGIPTRLTYKDSQQGLIKVVETYTIRKIVGNSDFFQCPKTFKKVANEQLVVDQRPADALEIMLGK